MHRVTERYWYQGDVWGQAAGRKTEVFLLKCGDSCITVRLIQH